MGSRFSDILIEGRRIRDLPGVKYGALRGKFDLYSVQSKKNGRSKYGCKRKKPDYLKTAKTKRNRNFKNRFYYKSFQKMYSLAIVNEGKTLDHQKYWLKCFFYFNLLFLNKKSKEWDSRGHFFSNLGKHAAIRRRSSWTGVQSPQLGTRSPSHLGFSRPEHTTLHFAASIQCILRYALEVMCRHLCTENVQLLLQAQILFHCRPWLGLHPLAPI